MEPTKTITAADQRGVVARLVYVFEQVMPDPFALSIGLTLLVLLLAVALAPHGSPRTVLTAWYTSTFNILGFALQMILILTTGYAVADAPVVQRGLRSLSSEVRTPIRAALLVFSVVAIAAWLNWGLGLVVGAFLAREIAKRVRVDFAWLVAGSYSAWSICNNGLSSSIALSQASHNNALNLVEKATGHLVPLSETVFAAFVIIPTVLVVIVMAAIFILIHPKPEDVVAFTETAPAAVADPHAHARDLTSFASRAERSVLGTVVIVLLGGGYHTDGDLYH